MPVPLSPPVIATEATSAESADTLRASSTPTIPVLPIADTTTGISASPAALHPAHAGEPSDPTAPVILDEDELRIRNEQLWEDEWKLVDSYRRGFVTLQELRLFLSSCGSATPVCDLRRFVEMYGDSAATVSKNVRDSSDRTARGKNARDDNGDDVFVLTKAGFLKFRREYTERDLQGSDQGLSSGDEDDDGEDPGGETAIQRDGSAGGGANSDGLKSTDPQRRRQSQWGTGDDGGDATNDDTSSIASSRRQSLIVVDPGVIDASHFDVEEDDEDELSQYSDANRSNLSVGLLPDGFADDD